MTIMTRHFPDCPEFDSTAYEKLSFEVLLRQPRLYLVVLKILIACQLTFVLFCQVRASATPAGTARVAISARSSLNDTKQILLSHPAITNLPIQSASPLPPTIYKSVSTVIIVIENLVYQDAIRGALITHTERIQWQWRRVSTRDRGDNACINSEVYCRGDEILVTIREDLPCCVLRQTGSLWDS